MTASRLARSLEHFSMTFCRFMPIEILFHAYLECCLDIVV